MRKLLSLCLLSSLLAAAVSAQAPALPSSLPARANVVAYDDENAIPKLAYRDSPYFLELADGWQKQQTDSSLIYTRQLDVEKVWRDFRVYLNVRGSVAVRVSLNGAVVGLGSDSRHWNEFLLSPHLKYGRQNTLAIETVTQSRDTLLEQYLHLSGLDGNPYILFKNDPEIADYTLLTDYDAASATGTLTIDARIFNGKKKGRYYLEAEVWHPNGRTLDRMGRWVVFDKTTDATVDLQRSWPGVAPWSAENPALYTLVLRLRDEEMAEEEVVGARFGFRRIEVKEGQLLLNGRAITLKGVTYTNHVFTRDMMRQTLQDMKAANVNAVRSAPYSQVDPSFYELCDQLGLYVVCDANLHPASSQHHAVATDKDFIPLFERRVENLHGIYKNYTSIIMWSLGDSRDNGICMQAAYRRLKALERQRPVVFSGADYSDNTDLIALSHPSVSDLRQAAAKSSDRPLIMLSSVKPNNFASLETLWATVESNRQLQGGFVSYWPLWADQHSDLKGLYSPFDVRPVRQTPDEAEFAVYNRQDFADFSAYRLEYTIFTNLRPNITAGDLPVGIAAGGADKVKVPIPPVDLQPGEELFVRFDLHRRNASRLSADNLLGTLVYPLDKAAPRLDPADIPNPEAPTVALPHRLLFLGHEDWRVDTLGRTHRTPAPNTACDDYMLRFSTAAGEEMCDVRATYTRFPSGDITVDYTLAPTDRLRGPALRPALRVSHGADSLVWFGLDREVCFQDRHSGILGIHRAAAADLDRRQVRWCAAYRGDRGLFVEVLGMQCDMHNDGANVTLIPPASNSLRLHLAPYRGRDPQLMAGRTFPEMKAGSVDPPVISAPQTRFTAPLTVTLASPAKGEIRYTLDGTEPTPSSPLYTKPFTITATTTVKARVYAPGLPPSFTATRRFNYDYIVAATFSRKPNTPYNVGTDTILFDGFKGNIGDLTRSWLGFSGDGVTVTLRLGKPIAVDNVLLRFAHAPQMWAFAPADIRLSFSADGTTYSDPLRASVAFDPASHEAEEPRVVELRVPVDRPEVSYVRITLNAIPSIPAWHRAKGLKPWLLMDEIEIIEK